MKILGAVLGFVVVVAVGAFIYLSVSDAHVTQTTITKNIPVAAE